MNQHTHLTAATALLGGVADPDWPRLLTGARRLLERVLQHEPPVSLVAHVLAVGDPELLPLVAASESAARRHPELGDRLAEVLEPAAAWACLLATRKWEYRRWEALLDRCDPADPAWQAVEPENWAPVLPYDLVSVLAHSPLPGHYLAPRVSAHRRRLTEREQVHILARIHRDDAVDEDAGRCEAAVTARFRAALAEPGGVDALVAEVDGTAAAIAALRAVGRDSRLARPHARERAGLDWSQVAAAHAEEPFPAAASAALAARGDCPDDIRVALFLSHPAAVAEKSAGSFAPLFAALGDGPEHSRAARRLISRLRADGRCDELVAHGRPATDVLDFARRPADSLDTVTWLRTPIHTLVRPILDETVGADPAAWRSLRRLLKRHKGTLRELCEAAAAAPDHDGPWPDAAPLPGPYHDAAPIGARKAFLALLDAAPTATQLALIPHLDPRTRADLFRHGVWRREWFEHVVEHGTPGQRLAFARTRAPLTPERIQRLLDLDEPGLGRSLFTRQELTDAQAARGLTGADEPPRRFLPMPHRSELSALDEGTRFAELFAGHPEADHDTAARVGAAVSWVRVAVATGRVTWAEVLRDGSPALVTLSLVSRAHPVDALPALREVVGTAKPTTEALLLALEMLDVFGGTVPELLATANAATTPTTPS